MTSKIIYYWHIIKISMRERERERDFRKKYVQCVIIYDLLNAS